MKCVVTGACGFIGSHLTDELLKRGHHVVAIDNLFNGFRENVDPRAELHIADVRNQAIQDLFKGADMVFHQAAIGSVPRSLRWPDQTYEANVEGFRNVLRICEEEEIKKLIFASSSSVYGDSRILPKREDEIGKQLSPYSVSKRVNELMAQVSPVKTVGLRYFNVFGPRQKPDSPYSAVIPKWIKSVQTNETITIHGDGTAFRDFTYIDDVIQANILAMRDLPEISEVFNIGTGRYTILNDVLVHIIRALNFDKYAVAKTVSREVDTPPPVVASLADISRAQKILEYSPSHDFISGLYKTVNSFTQKEAA